MRAVHRTPTRLLLSSSMAFCLAAVPSMVLADTISFSDRPKDIQSTIDIRNVRVSNETRTVVTVQHESLRRSDPIRGLSIFIDTNAARGGPEFVFAAGVGDGTDWQIFRARNWRASIGPLNCSTEFSINYSTDVTRASIARGCLDGAGRVRVSVVASANSQRDWAPGYRTFSRWVPRG